VVEVGERGGGELVAQRAEGRRHGGTYGAGPTGRRPRRCGGAAGAVAFGRPAGLRGGDPATAVYRRAWADEQGGIAPAGWCPASGQDRVKDRPASKSGRIGTRFSRVFSVDSAFPAGFSTVRLEGIVEVNYALAMLCA
jgi:hypothetical protein